MISRLDKNTIDKIAAGEVVERPQSVIKELLENAIDAGASAVSIELKEGGTALIRVTDNGSGISEEDLPLVFVRHATSKLHCAEDLIQIRTMGFRGEALASISGVSQLELITKTREEIFGSRCLTEGGSDPVFSRIGAPEGTSIIIRNLFYNVPARKKFLKSPHTEGACCRDIIEKMALACPEISFTLRMDMKQVLYTPGTGVLLDAIYAVYGREVSGELLEVHGSDPEVRVSGFIGKPSAARSRRDCEIYFVNRRTVKSSLIDRAIEDGASGFMMQHRFPFAVLMIELSPSLVDVNVHPRKTQVRFSDEQRVYQAVTTAVREAFLTTDVISNAISCPSGKEAQAAVTLPIPEPFERSRQMTLNEAWKTLTGRDGAPCIPTPETASPSPKPAAFTQEAPSELRETPAALVLKKQDGADPSTDVKRPALIKDLFSEYRVIGQAFNTYWIVEQGNDLFLIDHHAAHEKVNYERMMHGLQTGGSFSQNLLIPLVLHLSAPEHDMVLGAMSEFEALGYEMEDGGGHDILVRSVPYTLSAVTDEELLSDLMSGLCEERKKLNSAFIAQKTATMACKASVKGGRSISETEFRALFDELMTLDNPYTCPHGRPAIIRWSRTELEKMFRRIL